MVPEMEDTYDIHLAGSRNLSDGNGSQEAFNPKQGRKHGNPVADGWGGAVMQKPFGIQKCDGPTDRRTDLPTYRPTRQGVESRARD